MVKNKQTPKFTILHHIPLKDKEGNLTGELDTKNTGTIISEYAEPYWCDIKECTVDIAPINRSATRLFHKKRMSREDRKKWAKRKNYFKVKDDENVGKQRD